MNSQQSSPRTLHPLGKVEFSFFLFQYPRPKNTEPVIIRPPLDLNETSYNFQNSPGLMRYGDRQQDSPHHDSSDSSLEDCDLDSITPVRTITCCTAYYNFGLHLSIRNWKRMLTLQFHSQKQTIDKQAAQLESIRNAQFSFHWNGHTISGCCPQSQKWEPLCILCGIINSTQYFYFIHRLKSKITTRKV